MVKRFSSLKRIWWVPAIFLLGSAGACTGSDSVTTAGQEASTKDVTSVPSPVPPPEVSLPVPTVTKPVNDSDKDAGPIGLVCWALDEVTISYSSMLDAQMVPKNDAETQATLDDSASHFRAASEALASNDNESQTAEVKAFGDHLKADIDGVLSEMESPQLKAEEVGVQLDRVLAGIMQGRFAYDSYPGAGEFNRLAQDPASGCRLE